MNEHQNIHPAIHAAEQCLELAVLAALAEADGGDGFYFLSLARVAGNTGLSRDLSRALLRSLTDQGLATYARGLFTDDGEVAGAGYGITRSGMIHLQAARAAHDGP
jgi:hypothetical protein